jgi:hypothetical protein
MKTIFTTLLLLSCITSACAQSTGETTFNYNKWKEQQEKALSASSPDANDDIYEGTLVKPTTIYADGYIMFGALHGAGFSLGGYVHNVNLEASYMHGLQESYQIERIYAESRHRFTYHPNFCSIKAGYGFALSKYLRITPQVGVGAVLIRGEQANETSQRGSDNSHVIDFVGSLRLQYQFTRYFGITVIPEYKAVIQKPDSYLDLTDSTRGKVGFGDNSDLEKWTKGFGCRLALTVNL